jgi:hypothetical protein
MSRRCCLASVHLFPFVSEQLNCVTCLCQCSELMNSMRMGPFGPLRFCRSRYGFFRFAFTLLKRFTSMPYFFTL